MADPYTSPTDSSVELPALRFARLALLQGAFSVAFSIAAGSIAAAQLGIGLEKFEGLKYAGRLLMLASVRSFGPAIAAWAALLALLVWSRPMPAAVLRANLERAAPRALPIAVAAAPVTTLLMIVSGFGVLHWVFGVSWPVIASSRDAVSSDDIPAAFVSFAVWAAPGGAFCWFGLPAMARRSWSLGQKLLALFGLIVLVRIVTALVYAVAAPPLAG